MTDTGERRRMIETEMNHELLEVLTHTDTPAHIKTHADTHAAPPLLCIFIYGCPHYMVPQSLSPVPLASPCMCRLTAQIDSARSLYTVPQA